MQILEKQLQKADLPTYLKINLLPDTHFVPVGCEKCFYTGYNGRKAIYEVIPIENRFAEKIKNIDFNISELLKEKGIKSLSDNAYRLFIEGFTSLEEVYPILTTG